jgi:hypothetical protein
MLSLSVGFCNSFSTVSYFWIFILFYFWGEGERGGVGGVVVV